MTIRLSIDHWYARAERIRERISLTNDPKAKFTTRDAEKLTMRQANSDLIPIDTARTLAGLFQERQRRSPDRLAYRYFDPDRAQWRDLTWGEMGQQIARWQSALAAEPLAIGDRVALMLRNCPEWVMLDQAALGLGLVTVPVYPNDRAQNAGYILEDSGAKILLIEGEEQWQQLAPIHEQLAGLVRVLSLRSIPGASGNLSCISEWLPERGSDLQDRAKDPNELATIVYTSGTTGRPKGVMLSHRNILWNAHSSIRCTPVSSDDLFLSFLPLSHTLERTVGYYAPVMTGSAVAYARSIPQLAEDLLTVRPTFLIAVPRIFERVYNRVQEGLDAKPPIARKLFELAVRTGWHRFLVQQGRASWRPRLLLWPLLDRLVAAKLMARLGGRIRLAVSGGAALSPTIGQTFAGLGLPLVQGYGLTETSPVISTNRLEDNRLDSVGPPIPGVEVRIGEHDELLVRSPGIMLGYWNQAQATAAMIRQGGWLHTGDQATLRDGHIYLTGRLKEIIVMATGEKMPPSDMEMAIALDPLFEQVMVIGEGRPFLAVIAVLNPDQWKETATQLGVDPAGEETLRDKTTQELLLTRIADRLKPFPGYAQVRRVLLDLQPWSVENGFITPTLKVRRSRVLEHYRAQIAALYDSH